MVRAHWNGAVVAESDDTVVIDGYHPSPTSAAASIAGRVAFWHGVKIEDEGRLARRRTLFDRFRRGLPASAVADVPGAPGDNDRGPVADVDGRTFFASLDGVVTVADFWAPWCGPCRALHPLFDAAAVEHATATFRFVRVNIDDSPGLAAALNIASIPTLVVFGPDGHELEREIGVPSGRRLGQLVQRAAAFAAGIDARGAA